MSDEVEKASRRLEAKWKASDLPKDVLDGIGLDLMDELNRSIVYELLAEDGVELQPEEFERLFVACKGNPWDAPILYQMLKMVEPK